MQMATKLADVFRDRVRKKLRERGWSQQDLANAMGVKKQYISHLMTGVRNPGFDSLERAAEALGCEACDLISEENGV